MAADHVGTRAGDQRAGTVCPIRNFSTYLNAWENPSLSIYLWLRWFLMQQEVCKKLPARD